MGQWQSQPVCTTPACIHAASSILKNLNPDWAKIDPCTNFDQMVCYGAPEHFGEDGGPMGDMGKRTANILRKILESPNHATAAGVKSTFLTARSNSEEQNFDMLRTVYQSCMDADAAAALGIQPLTELIVSINKAWPVSPADLKTKVGQADFAGLQKASLFIEELGVPAFHSYCLEDNPIMPDFLDSKTNRVCFGSPKLILQENNLTAYTDPAVMEVYPQIVAKAFRLAYPKLGDETASKLGTAVASFEADLADLLIPYAVAAQERDDQGYGLLQNVTLDDIGAAAPAFGFDKLITSLTPTGKTPSTLLLEEPEFWPQFSALVSNHSRAAVQGYMIWKTVASLAGSVEAPALWEILGAEPLGERWQQCIGAADGMLRHILDHYYVLATYPELTLQAADKMTTNIRAQFKKRLAELDWMSAEAKQRAIKKAENIVQNIGYPKANPDLRSAESLASYYAGINITTDFFTNVLSARRFKTAKAYAEVANAPNRNSMDNIADVNAYYSPWTNSITIPAGISQLSIFHYHLPDYALYGGLGSVIGHEITHGFDNSGRQWSEDAEREAWWDNSTIAAFEKRAQCFVDQYSAFEVDTPFGRQKVDGLLTLGENLSDAGGLRAAYDAWVEDRKAMPNSWDQKLPGLESFTSEQLFFIAYANTWCETPSLQSMVRILADEHAPSVLRIRGGTQNSRAFREAFKCKVKEPVCELF